MKFMPELFGHDEGARVDRLDPRPPRLATSLLALPLRRPGRGRSR
ncbi:MAG TPA: hypothetical protein VJT84_01800 [Gaiellaceae bacterium]|nr:hypothetical protein [Gaiellaceae bacterium]